MNAWTPGAMLGRRRWGTRRDPNEDGGRGMRKENAPSRWRFRPPGPPTFRLRFPPPGSDSSYRRSVLDAVATLSALSGKVQDPGRGKARNLQKVQFSTFPQLFAQYVEKGVESTGAGITAAGPDAARNRPT